MFSYQFPYENDKTFFFTTAGASTDFRPWTKPQGMQFVYILAIGGGGGGGNGATGATATARGGGGGGGGACIATGIWPAFLLPDTLYVNVGLGGTSAIPGSASLVSLYPSTLYPIIRANGGAAGGNASGTTAGAAATAQTSASVTAMALGNHGMLFFNAGTVGYIGGSGTSTTGTNAVVLGSSITCGGAGGGGITTANAAGNGGTVVAANVTDVNLPTITANGDGTTLFKPVFISLGGAGAPGLNAAAAAGGKGGLGCGGGGGGGGTTGGAGGAGGNGIVIISCW